MNFEFFSPKKKAKVQNSLDVLFIRVGFLPFLHYLAKIEREERYEDCAIVRDFVRQKARDFDIEMPTILGKEAVSLFCSEFPDKKSAKEALNIVPRYATFVEMEFEEYFLHSRR